VEDDADSRDALQFLLEHSGHRVSVAAGGQEGIALAASLTPDWAVIDIGLPDIDGYEAARRIAVFRPAALIVLISVADEALAGDPTERCGAAAFVRKEDLRPALLRDLWATHQLPKAEEPPAASVGPA